MTKKNPFQSSQWRIEVYDEKNLFLTSQWRIVEYDEKKPFYKGSKQI